eukprot:scaffold76545_cov20-Tisochrysis_lutea.AAC.6
MHACRTGVGAAAGSTPKAPARTRRPAECPQPWTSLLPRGWTSRSPSERLARRVPRRHPHSSPRWYPVARPSPVAWHWASCAPPPGPHMDTCARVGAEGMKAGPAVRPRCPWR